MDLKWRHSHQRFIVTIDRKDLFNTLEQHFSPKILKLCRPLDSRAIFLVPGRVF